MNMNYKFFLLIPLIFFGCSGGEADYSLSDINPDAQGKFIDDAVSGLEYTRSNGERAITMSSGDYSYRKGELITFNVGAVDIGTASAGFVITPRELAVGATVIEDPRVYNRVRFIKALDSSEGIGIEINTTLREQALQWEDDIDFNLDALAFDTEVARVTHNELTLKHTKDAAIAQFRKTLSCVYSGAYQGAWNVPDSNESSGYVGVMVQADSDVILMGNGRSIPALSVSSNYTLNSGQVLPAGTTIVEQNNSVMYVVGTHDVNTKSYGFDTNVYWYYNRTYHELLGVNKSNGNISGTGTYLSYDKVLGTFSIGAESGSYHVYRADASRKAAFRYTGIGVQDSVGVIGLLIMDIDKDGSILGLIHDVRNTAIQPQLHGSVDFSTGNVNITVVSPELTSYLTGNLYENDTAIETLRDVNLSWHNEANDVNYGYVEIDGCQLQAIQ